MLLERHDQECFILLQQWSGASTHHTHHVRVFTIVVRASAVRVGLLRGALGTVTNEWTVHLLLILNLLLLRTSTPQLELRNELLHCAFLLPHIVLEYLYLGFEAYVLLTVPVKLDFKLDRILVKLLLFFDIVTIRGFDLHFSNWLCGARGLSTENGDQLLLRGLLLIKLGLTGDKLRDLLLSVADYHRRLEPESACVSL